MNSGQPSGESSAQADIVIIGAGPVGLFAAFQLGLFGFRCHIVDALKRVGGQCIEYYADKPIYDVPAWPAITGQELIDRLLEQLDPFSPAITLETVATSLRPLPNSQHEVGTSNGTSFIAPAVIVAGGWGVIGESAAGEPPVSGWGIGFREGVVPVEPSTFGTCMPGVFAIGDMCFYPGKLRLLLSGFHEAALAAQAIRKLLRPDARGVGQYTSSSTELQRKLGVRPA